MDIFGVPLFCLSQIPPKCSDIGYLVTVKVGNTENDVIGLQNKDHPETVARSASRQSGIYKDEGGLGKGYFRGKCARKIWERELAKTKKW